MLRASLLGTISILVSADPSVRASSLAPTATETLLIPGARPARSVSWALGLRNVSVIDGSSRVREDLGLYTSEGEVDSAAKARFEALVAHEGDAHVLSERVLKLVFKAAYRFANKSGAPPALTVVSAWRGHAGRHTSGQAIDFKLAGVRAASLAAYLRGLARVGVGIYTHPRTQYVHLDVRDQSYHWLDASPPGVHWRERQLRDPGQAKRDDAWTPEADLPIQD